MNLERHTLFVIISLLAAMGCGDRASGGSPQPEPTPGGAITIHSHLVELQATGEGVEIIGNSGAVSLSPGTLFVFNIDSPSPASTSPVDADGSFQVSLPGSLTDTFRVVVEVNTTGYFSPDFTVWEEPDGQTKIETGTLDCVAVLGDRGITLNSVPSKGYGTTPFEVWNECSTDIQLSSITVHDGQAVSIASEALPIWISPKQSAVIEVGFSPPSPGVFYDLLMLQRTPDSRQFAITVRGESSD